MQEQEYIRESTRLLTFEDKNSFITFNTFNQIYVLHTNFFIADIDFVSDDEGDRQSEIFDTMFNLPNLNDSLYFIYRTFKGLRVFESISDFSSNKVRVDLLTALKSDVKYIKYCAQENIYAARLSPKPDRATNKNINYRVCNFLGSFGNKNLVIPDQFTRVLKLHDLMCSAYKTNKIEDLA